MSPRVCASMCVCVCACVCRRHCGNVFMHDLFELIVCSLPSVVAVAEKLLVVYVCLAVCVLVSVCVCGSASLWHCVCACLRV